MDQPGLLFQQLAISLLLGLLVGLQRERTDSDLAGFRTFPLITVFGSLCAMLATEFGSPWAMPAGIVAIISLMLIGNLPKLSWYRLCIIVDFGYACQVNFKELGINFEIASAWSHTLGYVNSPSLRELGQISYAYCIDDLS